MNPSNKIEVRDTDHFFYRLDLFQSVLEQHANQQQKSWKPNVRAMTKQWLAMGLRPRAVTRDLNWGIPLPLDGGEWDGKCIMCGLRLFRAIRPVPKFGRGDLLSQMDMTWVQMLGSSGGILMNKAINQNTSIS